MVDVPRIPSVDGLRKILDRRIERVMSAIPPFEEATADDVVDAAALELLFEEYADGKLLLRDVIRIMHVAIVSARDAGAERVGTAIIASSIAADRT